MRSRDIERGSGHVCQLNRLNSIGIARTCSCRHRHSAAATSLHLHTALQVSSRLRLGRMQPYYSLNGRCRILAQQALMSERCLQRYKCVILAFPICEARWPRRRPRASSTNLTSSVTQCHDVCWGRRGVVLVGAIDFPTPFTCASRASRSACAIAARVLLLTTPSSKQVHANGST